MYTRQLRISAPIDLLKQVPPPLGKVVTLVLLDKVAFTGEVVTLDQEGISIRNGRRKIRFYAFQDIDEIYIDSITP